MEVRPEILHYQDYRKFLADFYQHKKFLRAGFSYRLFASRAKLKSPNYLQLVIQGKRNLSDEAAPNVAQAMSLTVAEQRYFRALVKRSNSHSQQMLEESQRELLTAVKQLVAKLIPKEQVQILRTWYILLVREFVFFKEFEPSGEWISQKMNGLISPEQAEDALGLLTRSGFLKQDKSGRWSASDPVIDTGPEGFAEAQVLALHKETLKIWSQHLQTFDHSLREMGLINIPMAKAKIPELQQRLRNFQEELIGWLQDEKNPDTLVQLGIYLIPVSSPR